MANIENLKPIKKGQLSKEEAKKRGKKGGLASVQARRQRKTCKEILLMISEFTPKTEVVESLKKIFPELKNDDITYKTVMTLKQMEKALKGDTEAFKVCRDTMGEKPTDKVEQKTEVKVKSGLSNKELKEVAKTLLLSKVRNSK